MNTATIKRAVVRERLSTDGRSYSPNSLPRAIKSRLRDHEIQEEWDALEDEGLVRMKFPTDEHADMDDLKGDSYNPKCCLPMNGGLRALKAQEKAFERRVEQDGICGMVGEYRTSTDEEWDHGDSVWGFVGMEDAEDSGYMPDIMQGTIEALRKAQESACPCCGRPAK